MPDCIHFRINFAVCILAEIGDVKATIAVLSFILSNATKFSVDGESLSSELQQLGFPKGLPCCIFM